MDNIGLVPLRNWGQIAPSIYRSAQPEYRYEWDWLAHFGMREVVNLRAERTNINEAGAGQFSHVRIPVVDRQPPTINQAVDFMKLVKVNNEAGRKTLIHCEHGHGRTSTFSVLAKVALGQSLDEAIQDERDRFHFQFKHHAQEAWLRENSRSLKSERFLITGT